MDPLWHDHLLLLADVPASLVEHEDGPPGGAIPVRVFPLGERGRVADGAGRAARLEAGDSREVDQDLRGADA